MEWMDENIIEWIHVWMNKISSRKKSYKILWIRAIEISIGWDQEASPSPDSFALWQLLQFLSSSLPSFFLSLSLFFSPSSSSSSSSSSYIAYG